MSTSLSHVEKELPWSLLLSDKLLILRLRVILSGRVPGRDSVLSAWLHIGIDADKKSSTHLLHTLGMCPNVLLLNSYGRAPSKTE